MSDIKDFVIENGVLKKYTGNETDVTIPDSVTSIDDWAFYDCESLTNVKIPDSVTSIGNGAFIDCSSLTSIVVDSNNKVYDSRDNCNAIVETATNTLLLGCKNTVIPNSVTSIGEFAFAECSNLTTITIPNSVKSIGDEAFYKCSSLTSIIIPNSVINIGERAFCLCSNITNIRIPDSVKCIGNDVFKGCDNVCVYFQNRLLADVDKTHKKRAFLGFVKCADMATVGDEIKESYIKYAKSQKKKLYSQLLEYPELLVFMTENKIIPLEDIDSIFEQINDNTELIAMLMDYKNANFTFEDKTKQLEKELNKNPLSITEMKKIWKFEKDKNGNIIINGYKGNDKFVHVPEEIGKNNVVAIDEYAFSPNAKRITAQIKKARKEIKEIIIPERVKRIGDFAFSGCIDLTSVTIPNSVKSIGDEAFYKCSSLTNITIPNRVKSIGDWAFCDCESLTSITIGNSVTSIGIRAFDKCSSLTSIIIPNSVTSIGYGAFSSCTGLTSVTIPDSVTSIGDSAFYGCTGLTSVTIPNSVTSIGGAAFRGCTGLTSILVNSDNSIYDSRDNCNAIIETKTNKLIAGCSNTLIPNSVTSIGDSAFRGCTGLTSITIPDSVTRIGNGAFYGCTGLTSVTIPNSVTSIGGAAFSECTGLTSITIPDSVTSIDGAFSGCTSLTSITIPDSVTSIGDYAFRGCTGLTSVTIGNSVTSIGDYAFYGCKDLIIHATAGSFAEQYAKENNISFIAE